MRVLDAAHSPDRELWRETWTQTEREPFAHPGYLELFETPDSQSRCALEIDDAGGILFPFHLREIQSARTNSSDLAGPYGYGGPLRFGNGSPHTSFVRELTDWLATHQVATAFLRLSLFPEELLDLGWPRTQVGSNIVVDLGRTEAEFLSSAAHKVRKNLRRATEAGLTVTFSQGTSAIPQFLKVYEATMDRREASDFYRFDGAWLEALVGHLEKGHLFAFVHGPGVLAAELVLLSRSRMYSFLGGTLEAGFPVRANDILKVELIRWGIASGRSAFVLGGGLTPDDGIYRYKRSFDPSGEVPFYVATATFDPSIVATLIEERQEADQDWRPREGFFPPYRA